MKIYYGSREYINSLTNKYPIIYNKFGKPFIKNNPFYYNKSHTKDLSVMIKDKNLCGIDIESIKNYNDLVAKKICSKEEYQYLSQTIYKDHDFTLLWVLKESYLKCIGTGLTIPLKNISFVKDNQVLTKINNYKIKIINKNNYIISVCWKEK